MRALVVNNNLSHGVGVRAVIKFSFERRATLCLRLQAVRGFIGINRLILRKTRMRVRAACDFLTFCSRAIVHSAKFKGKACDLCAL